MSVAITRHEVVRHHHDGGPVAVELGQQPDDDLSALNPHRDASGAATQAVSGTDL
jgi:hypothetical protein